ncbi:MAG: secondary thiamine-phosphate synthase enzyme YjbQ [Candidatus Thermoplasmatota archaeon]|nr:secondary thiamine-phosphate synthase enzyme YjbQ [Candidatus Thermoplasmatota archaeon]
MSVYYDEINIKTKGEVDIIDITQDVQKIVNKSKIKNGIVCVFIPGSTGCITTIEYEPGLKKDLPRILQKIAPKDEIYLHHETWNDDNGHSHVRASLIGPSLTIPIKDEKLLHGVWQQIVFIELDTTPRKRNIVVEIVGE